jgi:transposase
MLHNEARNLLVEAYEKSHNAKNIAEAYGVSVSTVYRLAEQKAKTGSVDLRVNQRGRKHVLGDKERSQIAQAIERQPDITLAELIEQLGLNAGIETVRRVILEMGYRWKKKVIHASEQERPRCAGQERTMAWIRSQNTGETSGISG